MADDVIVVEQQIVTMVEVTQDIDPTVIEVETADDVTVVEQQAVTVVEVTSNVDPVVIEVEVPGLQGPPGAKGERGPQGGAGTSILTLIAGQILSGHRVITYEGLYADPTDPFQINRIAGITLHSAVQGEQVQVAFYGEVVEGSWSWDTGAPIYLGANGYLTQACPQSGFLRILANPITATRILIDMREPIKL